MPERPPHSRIKRLIRRLKWLCLACACLPYALVAVELLYKEKWGRDLLPARVIEGAVEKGFVILILATALVIGDEYSAEEGWNAQAHSFMLLVALWLLLLGSITLPVF